MGMTDGKHAFWSCSEKISLPNGLDICEIMLELFGFLANLIVTVLLFLLRTKKPEDLALLRVLSLSCLVSSLVSFLYDVLDPSPNTGNSFIDDLVCIFWSTRFAYWYSRSHIYHSLFFFAFNRGFEILQLNHYPFITEKQRRTGYMLLVLACSLLSTAPQLLQARLHTINCACATPTENFALLSIIYAHTFLWSTLLGFIYPALLVCICTALLVRLWRSERGALVDELEELAFPNPRSSSSSQADAISISSFIPSKSGNGKKRGAGGPGGSDAISTHYIWSASFCIIPLTAAYIATFTYDAAYQFLSAAGVLTYTMDSPNQQFSDVLLTLFTALVPLILFFHISAMRSLIFVAIASIQKRLGKRNMMDVEGHIG